VDNLTSLFDYLWVAVFAMVGFMFRKLFAHDAKLGEHDIHLALLRQQGDLRIEQAAQLIRESREHHKEQMELLERIVKEKENG